MSCFGFGWRKTLPHKYRLHPEPRCCPRDPWAGASTPRAALPPGFSRYAARTLGVPLETEEGVFFSTKGPETSRGSVQFFPFPLQGTLRNLGILANCAAERRYRSVLEITMLTTSGVDASSSPVPSHVFRPLITTFFFPADLGNQNFQKLSFTGKLRHHVEGGRILTLSSRFSWQGNVVFVILPASPKIQSKMKTKRCTQRNSPKSYASKWIQLQYSCRQENFQSGSNALETEKIMMFWMKSSPLLHCEKCLLKMHLKIFAVNGDLQDLSPLLCEKCSDLLMLLSPIMASLWDEKHSTVWRLVWGDMDQNHSPLDGVSQPPHQAVKYLMWCRPPV